MYIQGVPINMGIKCRLLYRLRSMWKFFMNRNNFKIDGGIAKKNLNLIYLNYQDCLNIY